MLDHEQKFREFMSWAGYPRESSVDAQNADGNILSPQSASGYVVQVVRQVNFGGLESKRYFVAVTEKDEPFVEVTEKDLVEANYEKLNSFKNFKCATHNKFFELNLYQKDPVNKHHWRADIARPAGAIDL